MNRVFNIAGDCKPKLHYMVDLHSRLEQMQEYVDAGAYFALNRARQYGKTTMLRAFKEYLKGKYYVVSMDFQMQMSDAKFRSEHLFCTAFGKAFTRILLAQADGTGLPQEMMEAAKLLLAAACGKEQELDLVELFQYLSDICGTSDKPLVLMVDEADQASGHPVFLDFLSQIRGYYIDRDQTPTFQSVILAGVYDIRNLKRRIPHNAAPQVDGRESHDGVLEIGSRNSPWNISVDFKVDMSFSPKDIAGMLSEYAAEECVEMDVSEMSGIIYEHTSGYPYLVSRLCKLIDEEVAGSVDFPEKKDAWTYAGFLKADRMLLGEKNTLFESMVNKLYDFPELKEVVYSILFTGKEWTYNALDPAVGTAAMFGFVKNEGGVVAIANRIFEAVFYNLFLTTAENQSTDIYKAAIQDKNQFIYAGHLNMELLLEKFVIHFDELYGDLPNQFKEEDGRRYFLLYLKPIINGSGNYYVEARTRNMERTDVVVDYRGEQMVVELKIWRGNAYRERGEAQLVEYLDHYHLKKGYMLSYNFNKKKEIGVKRIVLGDKVLIEAVV